MGASAETPKKRIVVAILSTPLANILHYRTHSPTSRTQLSNSFTKTSPFTAFTPKLASQDPNHYFASAFVLAASPQALSHSAQHSYFVTTQPKPNHTKNPPNGPHAPAQPIFLGYPITVDFTIHQPRPMGVRLGKTTWSGSAPPSGRTPPPRRVKVNSTIRQRKG